MQKNDIKEILQQIFSVKNDGKHKVLRILGIKIKFRRKYTINIAMITDNNYVLPTIVAINSLRQNKDKNSRYNINIITTKVSQENKKKLLKCKYKNLNINLLDKSKLIEQFSSIEMKRHVSQAALLKFFLPEIFPKLNKILYLDSDIIIQQDLAELYNTPISEYYAAVVKDTLCVLNKEYMNKLGIDNEYYFNSGVMLLNLNLLRKDNISKKLLDFKQKKDQMFMDQDAFNAIIGHNVKYISYKYNFLNYYLTIMNKKDLSEFFDECLNFSNDSDLYKSCSILHLGGKEKPWLEEMGYLSDLYKQYM